MLDVRINVPYTAVLQAAITDAVEFTDDCSIHPFCSTSLCGPSSDYGNHGQSVSETILSVAPQTKLWFARVVTTQDLVRGMNHFLGSLGQTPKLVAINISLSIGQDTVTDEGTQFQVPLYSASCPNSDSALSELINVATANNVVVVAATGNDGNARSVVAPSCMPNVLSVGAVADSTTAAAKDCNNNNLNADQIPCFSIGGNLVKILAPGVGISDSSGYSYTGTSLAAPHVSGAVAVLRGTNSFPADTASQTINRVTSTGKSIVDPRTALTFPRLQLDQAAGVTRVGINPPNCKVNPRLCA